MSTSDIAGRSRGDFLRPQRISVGPRILEGSPYYRTFPIPMKALRNPRCLLLESRWLVPRHFDGISLGPIVLLRPGVSAGLIAHELVHVRQFWRRPFTHGPRYLLSKAYRQACEVEAYQAQLHAAGRTPSRIANLARYLATRYRLDIDQETAVRLLSAEDSPR